MRPRKTLLPLCWFASLTLHALAFAWLASREPSRLAAAKTGSATAPPGSPSAAPEGASRHASPAEELRSLEETLHELAALEAARREELRASSPAAELDPDRIAEAQQKASLAQSAATEALRLAPDPAALASATDAARVAREEQAAILEALVLADPTYDSAYHAQAAANSAQLHASQTLAEAEARLADVGALEKKNAPATETLAETGGMSDADELRRAEIRGRVGELTTSLATLESDLAEAKAELDAARAAGDKPRQADAKKLVSENQKAVSTARRNLARAENDIVKLEKRAVEQAARAAKIGARPRPPTESADALRAEADEKLAEATRLATEAAARQAEAARVFADARAGIAPPPRSEIPAEDLAATYEAARLREGELAEAFRRLRAADLALRRDIPFARALELTDTVLPVRADLSAQLGSAGAAANGELADSARAQIAAMRTLADSMLARARTPVDDSARRSTLERLAAEDESQRAKDLTQAMRGGSGSKWGFGFGSGSGSTPPSLAKGFEASPGRVVGPDQIAGRGVFVVRGYLLGPFDNAGRTNIDKQFPPESLVDLDATYAGKRGSPVSWRFYQSPQPRVVPPFDDYNPLPDGAGRFRARGLEYIIYYAYTELRAIRACDVWLAVGSDDFSKVWIEDQLVWASGKQQKSWRADEGYRKVSLKEGINRVLVRVENGHMQSEFSLALSAP